MSFHSYNNGTQIPRSKHHFLQCTTWRQQRCLRFIRYAAVGRFYQLFLPSALQIAGVQVQDSFLVACLNHMLKLWLTCVNWHQGQWWIALVILYKIWSVTVLLLALLSSALARIQQRRCCSWWSITTTISEWPFQSQHIWISSQVMETTFFHRSNCGSRRPHVSLAEATSFHRYPFSLLLWFSFWSPPEEFMSYDTWCTITLSQMDL
jgi:hypothetical protein